MKNKRGFTLIELVIVLALLGIVLSMIYSPIIFSFKNFDIQNEKANIISDARATMDYLTRAIRKADTVEVVDGNLSMDSKMYKLEDRVLFKEAKKVMEGIDELNINKVDKTINIEIVIKNSKGENYKLSSIINIR
ncbi:prepilin-type N-terminal cleavage/methylation domain-containing protein [Proteiniclasticum sp.]|uniref:PilW family protein n=1 Tax=Proteiniclasticum sp. TaxID=2053595 RepID=UPI00289AC0B5|nr:prepilin-type N-terminal cleavage/methylation domain-containing protein [Proteiniclasticum sp.]